MEKLSRTNKAYKSYRRLIRKVHKSRGDYEVQHSCENTMMTKFVADVLEDRLTAEEMKTVARAISAINALDFPRYCA